MAFKFKMDQEQLNRPEPLPQNIYNLRLVAFKAKTSKDKESINFNPIFEFIAPGEKYDGRKLLYAAVLNSKAPSVIQDLVHSVGEIMELDDSDPNNQVGLMPGIWDADQQKFRADDPSTWVYQGPLLNKELKAELYIKSYQGRDSNAILRFICRVPDCAQRFPKIQHSDNLNWGSKD